MSMPLNFNAGKSGLIEVTEDATHFLVRIHPEDRDRAKRISGRQWDGDRKAWVYLKEPTTYDALVAEFQKDADTFEIRRPKTKRPTGIKPPAEAPNDDEFEEFLVEFDALDDRNTNPDKLQSEIEQIRLMLESLRDAAANQERILGEVRGTQEETAQLLTQLEPITQLALKTEPVAVLPDRLELTKQKDIELVEKAIVMIACSLAGGSRSFVKQMNDFHPLSNPTDFVSEIHEFLKMQLAKLLGDEDSEATFYELTKQAEKEKIFFINKKNAVDRPIHILHALNSYRNRCIGHPFGLGEWEKHSLSLLYLFNLALIWKKVVIEPKQDGNGNG